MIRLTRTVTSGLLLTLFVNFSQAETISVNFDELPPIRFSVTLADGTRISETPEGTFEIVDPAGETTIVPLSLVPDGILPAEGEVPIAAPLPEDVSDYIAFSTDVDAALYYFSGSAAVGSSVPNNITAAVDPNAFPYSSNLYAEFLSPVNDLSFSISSDNDEGEIAQVIVAYGNGQNVEIPVIGNADPTDAILIDLTSYADVRSVHVVEITDTFGLSYDDFAFSATVPEPEFSLPMVCILCGGMMACRRRSS